jgi:hypothetical protein
MGTTILSALRITALTFVIALVPGCKGSNGPAPGPGATTTVYYDVDKNGIPKFVRTDYIELSKINEISRFRSAAGHDYRDDFEKCRSLKHYFWPAGGDPGMAHTPSWAEIQLHAPVSGTVSRVFEEWAGAQVQIQSKLQPGFYFIIFHVNQLKPLAVGDTVSEGQLLGNHIGDQTMSDMAVGVTTPTGWKLVSYFDVMTDSLFLTYQARGIANRDSLIISKTARDTDPLTCNGETFTATGSIPDWVMMK